MAPPNFYFRFGLGGAAILSALVLASADRLVERLGRPLDAGEGKVLSQSNITFLLEDLSLTDGVLFALSAFFLSQDPVRFQVWRPESTINRMYTLLWDARVTAPKRGILTVHFRDLPGVDCPPVQQGDRIGIYAENGPMPIAYTFLSRGSPATLRHPLGSRDSHVSRGQTVIFDALRYPYRYSVNAFVHTDLNVYANQKSIVCPNVSASDAKPENVPPPSVATHPPKFGATGHTGPAGPPGVQGPPGFPYPGPPLVSSTSKCDCNKDGSLLHNHIILGIFIWLTAITVLNLCFLVVLCCRCVRKMAAPKATPAPAQNDQNMWVETVRETVREFSGNATGISTALTPMGPEGKLRLDYEVPLPQSYEKEPLD